LKLVKVLCVSALFLALWLHPSHAQDLRGKWGVGGFVAYNMPMYGFGDRFGSEVNKWGLNFSYVANPRVTMEVEYHHASLDRGVLETKPFMWGVTKKEYASKDVNPDSRYDMKFNSLLLSGMVHFRANRSMEEGSYSPYIVVGAGYYNHDTVAENILWPGQTELDAKGAGAGVDANGDILPAVVMQTQQDTRTAVAANVGVGLEAFLTRTIAIDVRGRYHFILSELRAYETWQLRKVFPMQMVDFAAGFKFYFWD